MMEDGKKIKETFSNKYANGTVLGRRSAPFTTLLLDSKAANKIEKKSSLRA